MMWPPAEFRVLYPTDFSGASRRVGPAIAQLAETCRVDLTIAHVVKPGLRSVGTHHAIDAVLAGDEGSRRPCRRLIVEGADPSASIAELCRRDRYDLIMAPASRGHRVRGLLTRSFRARLLQRCGVPLWTAGPRPLRVTSGRRLRTIACLVDFDSPGQQFLRLVTTFVRRFDARLHLLAVVPPLDEGALAHALTSDTPLLPGAAANDLHRLCPDDICADVDVAVGSRGRELARLLARCTPDLLFVSRRQWTTGSWAFRFSRHLDRLPCPVVCLDDKPEEFAGWSFADQPASRFAAVAMGGAREVAS